MNALARAVELAFHALTPTEQAELRRLLFKMALALVAATGLLTWFVVVPSMNQAGGPTPPTTASDEVHIVARAPGPGYNVKAFCDDPATKVAPPLFPVGEDIGRLVASRGNETVNWPGKGAQMARHEWVDDRNTPQGEDVEMTPSAVECFLKKATR